MPRLLLAFALCVSAFAQAPTIDLLKNLKFREIGPANMGGRIDDFAVVESNTNIVYAATASRGVFKTTDGGKSWSKVLYIDADTGVNDIAMDPMNPDTLYAAAYQRRRSPFGMNGGGPGSGIYRTTDGGATWKKLSNGLPKTEM